MQEMELQDAVMKAINTAYHSRDVVLEQLQQNIDTPTNNESAGKKKSVRVSKAGCYIKSLPVQCANAVVTGKKHLEIRNRYLSLKKRRGHKKAIIARNQGYKIKSATT